MSADDAQHEMEFDTADAGSSLTYPQQCSALRKGGHVLIKGRPCKIIDMTTSKTGKHGHAKVHLTGLDIFTDRRLEDLSPSTHNMEVPDVKRHEFTLIDISSDGFLSLMRPDGSMKDDVKLPKERPKGHKLENIEQDFENMGDGKSMTVVVLISMGEENAMDCKVVND